MAPLPVLRIHGATDTQVASSLIVSSLHDFPQKVWSAFSYHSRLAKLLVYIDQHFDQPLCIDQASTVVCMERTAFCRFFRRSTGTSFMDFLRVLRIKRALVLLKTGDEPITEVAAAVGYASVTVFQRHFKAQVGMTAREYRVRIISGKAA